MNNQSLIRLISESAKLEDNAAKLYLLFSKLFTEDSAFWLTLHAEEINHRKIYEAFLNNELPLYLFPEEIIESNLDALKKSNATIQTELKNFLSRHKKKIDAYQFAARMEELAGEIHFQQAMSSDSDSESLLLIQRINKDDKDHKSRIEELIKQRSGEHQQRSPKRA